MNTLGMGLVLAEIPFRRIALVCAEKFNLLFTNLLRRGRVHGARISGVHPFQTSFGIAKPDGHGQSVKKRSLHSHVAAETRIFIAQRRHLIKLAGHIA